MNQNKLLAVIIIIVSLILIFTSDPKSVQEALYYILLVLGAIVSILDEIKRAIERRN